MENVYIDLGDDMTIGDGSSMVIGEDNLLTESETMTGPQGPPGPPGPAGFSPVATVTQNAGSATITITDATTTSSATVYDGQDGTDGAAATITVGSTTTGEPGTQASVTNSGSSSAAVLDFVIPKGAKGDQGEQGDAATVDVGTIVSIAPDATPQVTNSGTVHDAILNFAIPQGYDGFSPVATVTQNTGSATITITDATTTSSATVYDGQDGAPGQTGPAGQDGQAATITVGSTTTGNAGTNASVTNSGTSSAAVLDFVIPRGADGQNGTNGTDGSDGFSPIATVTQNTGSATISITDKNGTTTATVYDGISPSYNYGMNVTQSIGLDVDDNKTVYRTILGSNSFSLDTSKWKKLGNVFGGGNGTIITVYNIMFVLRDSSGNNFCSYGYDGGGDGSSLGTNRPLLAKVLPNGDVLIACSNDNFGAARIRVTIDYTKQ